MSHKKSRRAGVFSLASATAIVTAICLVALWAYLPFSIRAQGRSVPAAVDAADAAPLHLESGAQGIPVAYLADIETAKWRDAGQRVLNATVLAVQRVDVRADTEDSHDAATVATDVAEGFVGRSVLLTVEERAARQLPAPGRAKVRLIAVPREGTVHLSVDQVVQVRAAAPMGLSSGPAVESLSAYHGPVGTVVTIRGMRFGPRSASSWVVVCGERAEEIINWSDTSVTFRVPSGLKRAGYVGVVVNGDASNGLYFIPFAQPRLDSISPREGDPGTRVTLKGVNFGASQGVGWVSFGGVPGEVISWSDTTIVVAAPRGPGAAYVGVVVHGMSSNGVLYAPYGKPRVTSIFPSNVQVGRVLTLTGTDFGVTPGEIVIGGVSLKPSTWSDTMATVTIPETVTAGYAGVRRSGFITSNGVYVRISPWVSSVSSWWAIPGAEVEIRGKGFGTAPAGKKVVFAGVEGTVISWSPTSVRALVPTTATSGYVGVGTRVSMSNGRYLVVTLKPSITAVDALNVSPGQSITITGRDFGTSSFGRVVIGGNQECEIVEWSDTRIVARIPEGMTSGYIGVLKHGVSSNGVFLTRIP